MLNKNRKILMVLVLLIILVFFLCYFFWPMPLISDNEDQITFTIYKNINNETHTYILNQQEANDFISLLKDTRLYHGVLTPDRFFSDKIIHVRVQGGGVSPIISIYYDTNKTYVFARISGNKDCRISNKDEIRSFIENVVNNRIDEFKP